MARLVAALTPVLTMTFITSLVALGPPSEPAVAPAENPPVEAAPLEVKRPPVELIDLTADQTDIVEWARELFAEASLELPPVVVRRHATDEPCLGRPGIAHDRDDHTEIGLCTDEADAPVEFLILHELAHAWDHHALDDERRAEFVEQRRLRGWRPAGATWYERGSEQAAEIVVWGLIDRPIRSVRIDQNSCAELEAGYRVLTGADPLHGFTDHC